GGEGERAQVVGERAYGGGGARLPRQEVVELLLLRVVLVDHVAVELDVPGVGHALRRAVHDQLGVGLLGEVHPHRAVAGGHEQAALGVGGDGTGQQPGDAAVGE